MLVKKTFKNLMHLMAYLIVLFIITLTIYTWHNSYAGYRCKNISGISYVNFSSEEIFSFHDKENVEVIKNQASTLYKYTLNNGVLKIDDKEFLLFGNGILNDSENVFYEKLKKFYSLQIVN